MYSSRAWKKGVGGLLALATGLAMTACGSPAATSSAPAASTGTPGVSPPASSVSASSTAAATGTLLAKVEGSGQLTVALAPFAPLEFQDATTKQWTGFDVDMLTAFAQTLGAKLVVDDMAFAATIQAVQSGRADITANIFKTPARAKQIAFSEAVLNYVDGVIVNSKKPQITQDTVAAMEGKTIATCRGCAEEAFVKLIPKATDQSFNTATDTFLAVSTGRVAAAFQPVMYEEYAVHENPSLAIKELGPIPKAVAGAAQQPQGFYGVPQGSGSQTLLAKLNAFLTQQCTDGATAKILAKYGLTSPSYTAGLC